jgi:hypothetical protein
MLKSPHGTVCYTKEPVRQSHYTVSFQGPAGSFQGFDDNVDVLQMPAFPEGSDVNHYIGFNSTIPVPSYKSDITGATCKFRFFSDSKSFKFWDNWYHKYVYKKDNDEVGLYSDVVGTGEFTFYSPTGGKCPSGPGKKKGSIKIEGCWPSRIQIDDFGAENDGDQLTYSVTIEATDVKFSGF